MATSELSFVAKLLACTLALAPLSLTGCDGEGGTAAPTDVYANLGISLANLDGGDHVIILNAKKISVSANKHETKSYVRHSGYPQGLKEESLGRLLERRPEEVVRRAIKGMLPKTRLGAQQLRKVKIYAGSDHPHQAQRPEPLA